MATAEEREAAPPASFAEGDLASSSSLIFQIWPPSQRTREAVIKRLVETLSAPSILSKRYGTFPAEEAASLSRRIEEEAFTAAAAQQPSDASSAAADELGIETLQLYSKEISKRMLEAVKARAPLSSSSSVDSPSDLGAVAPAATADA
ncbi:MFP1 attachment factor 1-like [Wolffia australiana]